MPDLRLLCDRPHVSTVDFRTARFVVCKACGLEVDGQTLTMGEEVPSGVLNGEALRQLYDTPLRKIETLEYALTDPELRQACEDHGVGVPEPEPASKPAVPDLKTLTRKELVGYCQKLRLSDAGNTTQLRKRIATFLGR